MGNNEKSCKEIFAERLKLLRSEKGLSQEALAKDLGISKGSLGFYETCKNIPSIEFLYYVSKYFNVSLDYLLGRSEVRTTEIDLKAVCDYTGLTDKAVAEIRRCCVNSSDGFTIGHIFNLLCEMGAFREISSSIWGYLGMYDLMMNLERRYKRKQEDGENFSEAKDLFNRAENDVRYWKWSVLDELSESIDSVKQQWLKGELQKTELELQRLKELLARHEELQNSIKGADDNGDNNSEEE